jgi:hypothetical protein
MAVLDFIQATAYPLVSPLPLAGEGPGERGIGRPWAADANSLS